MADKVTPDASLSIEIRDSLAQIAPDQWNALCDDGNPFLHYEFLYSLECTDCLGQHNGWYPRYFLLWQGDVPKQLVGAMPAYLKTNSYGEFVFDWAWAEAYERNNMPYYPKLVCSIPFTPATGQRILVHPTLPRNETRVMLANAARQYCHSEDYSGVHWLFVTDAESDILCSGTSPEPEEKCSQIEDDDQGSALATNTDTDTDTDTDTEIEVEVEGNGKSISLDLLRRIDCQYHWQNNNYENFDDFLNQCTAKRRKTIRRERRYITDANIRVDKRMGNSLTDQEWSWVHELYQSTFDRKWGNPSLTLAFFKRIGAQFGGNVLIILAYDDTAELPEMPIACSVMFVGETVLYGRYWGCREQHNSLHFEACYYQGIEYCVEKGLAVFEPGAQGEHKITRGFVPTITQSAHYIAHSGFRGAIAEFLDEEAQHVEQRCEGLTNRLPFKHQGLATTYVVD